MAMPTTLTYLQLIMVLSLLACFLGVVQVSGTETKMPPGSEGLKIQVTSRFMLKAGAMKSCKASLGLCSHDCLTGCCNERCSKQFKNGTGKCFEPMLPTAPCLCQYAC